MFRGFDLPIMGTRGILMKFVQNSFFVILKKKMEKIMYKLRIIGRSKPQNMQNFADCTTDKWHHIAEFCAFRGFDLVPNLRKMQFTTYLLFSKRITPFLSFFNENDANSLFYLRFFRKKRVCDFDKINKRGGLE